MVFLSLAAARAGVLSQPTPDWRAVHDSLIADTIDLADDAHKLQYANVHLEAARRRMSSPRFTAALELVRRAG